MNGAQAEGCSPVAQAFAAGTRRLPPGQAGHDRQVAGDRQPGRRPVRGRARAQHRRRHRRASTDDEIRAGIRLLAETTGIFTETAGGVTTAVLAKLAERGDIDPRRARRALHHRRRPEDDRRRPRHVRGHRDRAVGRRVRRGVRARRRSDGGHGQAPDAAARRGRRRRPRRRSTAARSARRSRRSTPSTASCASGSSDDDGGLRRFVNVYLGGEDIRFLDGLDTAGRRRRRADDPAGGRRRLSRPTPPRAARSRRRPPGRAPAPAEDGGERLHALGHRALVGARRSRRGRPPLQAVELLHVRAARSGTCSHVIAVRAAQVDHAPSRRPGPRSASAAGDASRSSGTR